MLKSYKVNGVSSGVFELLKFVCSCIPNVEVIGSCNSVRWYGIDIFIPSFKFSNRI